MNKILFVKYNRTRKPEYQIKTEILNDGTDTFVLKTSLNNNANKHVSNLEKYAIEINEVYSNFEALVPQISEDGSEAKYPFIEGVSEEEYLKQYLDDKDALINELQG